MQHEVHIEDPLGGTAPPGAMHSQAAVQRRQLPSFPTRRSSDLRESASSDRPAGANDPALGLGQSNKIRSEPIRRYLVNDLGVDTDLGYYSLNLDLNFEWDWRSRERAPEFRVNPSENLANAMHEKSSFRLLVIGGFFDMATPVKGVEHTFTRSIFSPGQIELLFVPTGHSPFSSDRSRPALTEAVGRFIQNQ